jgi:hypothetical protein
MGDIIHTICFVVENEKDGGAACAECHGGLLQTITQNEEIYTSKFPVDAYMAGANLVSYRFDDAPAVGVTDYPKDLRVLIPVPLAGYKHLCLKYNREGGPRINVVAMIKQTQIGPAKIPANGLDAACPIEAADIGGATVELDTFVWDAGQPTILPDFHLGAWSIGPPDNVTGDLTLTFRPTLTVPLLASPGGTGTVKFVSWERNRLSSWAEETEHQWTGSEMTVAFEANTYMGVIVYYQPVGIGGGDIDPNKDTDWGQETPGYPAPKWRILGLLIVVWRVIFRTKR